MYYKFSFFFQPLLGVFCQQRKSLNEKLSFCSDPESIMEFELTGTEYEMREQYGER